MRRNSVQNASSNDTDVRCPCKVSERLTGRPLVIFEFQRVKTGGGLGFLRGIKQTRGFGTAMFDRIGVRRALILGSLFYLAGLVEIDDAHLGPIMSSGRTTLSKVSASTKPRLIASSRKVVPFLWAVLATVVALS